MKKRILQGIAALSLLGIVSIASANIEVTDTSENIVLEDNSFSGTLSMCGYDAEGLGSMVLITNSAQNNFNYVLLAFTGDDIATGMGLCGAIEKNSIVYFDPETNKVQQVLAVPSTELKSRIAKLQSQVKK